MHDDIKAYNQVQQAGQRPICEALAQQIHEGLRSTENKLWHGHPVWFIEGNPIVGYSKQKPGIRLMFWSGADFNEPKLQPSASGKFKDASIFYNAVDEIDQDDLSRWLDKAATIQWDYKNIVKRQGVLKRLH